MADNGSVSMVGEEPIPPPPCLMKAEVSWMSTVRGVRGQRSYKEHPISRRIRGILNKLTVEKYKPLKTQLLNLITTPYLLGFVAHLIFQKALEEPMFCPLYAFLCSELLVLSFPSDEPQEKEITFRYVLLNKCQEFFECTREDMKAEQTRQQIIAGSSNQDLWRSLGVLKFICELLKQEKILSLRLAHDIVMELVEENDVDRNVEAVCLLLNAISKKLDQRRARTSKRIELFNETCFGWLKDVLTTHPQLETRLKFMIRDLLELRENNWVDLRHNNKDKEKTIPELISASEADAFSRLHLGTSTSTNTRNSRRAVQFRPVNRPADPRRW